MVTYIKCETTLNVSSLFLNTEYTVNLRFIYLKFYNKNFHNETHFTYERLSNKVLPPSPSKLLCFISEKIYMHEDRNSF